jgi:hypothetical protein
MSDDEEFFKIWAANGLYATSSLVAASGVYPKRRLGRLSTSIPAAGAVLLKKLCKRW